MDNHLDLAIHAAGRVGVAYIQNAIQSNHSALATRMAKKIDLGSPATSAVIVHSSALEEAENLDFNAGLRLSPTQFSPDKKLEHRIGVNDVVSQLATILSTRLNENHSLRLSVPDDYAKPSDFDLHGADHECIVIEQDQVFFEFESPKASVITIKRTLAKLIAGYSVAWLSSEIGKRTEALIAIVSAFDGDGWVVAGKDLSLLTTSNQSIGPKSH